MRYFVDTNCLAEFNRQRLVPGLYERVIAALTHLNEREVVFSVRRVYDEIIPSSGDLDRLAQWATEIGSRFFLHPVPGVIRAYTRVMTHLTDGAYRTEDVGEFINGADPYLIAAALHFDGTVVTQEKRRPDANRITIPEVCDQLGIPIIAVHELWERPEIRSLVGDILNPQFPLMD